jgi:hypothetical protein
MPLDAVTETFAILAKRGAGKSYLGVVLVEELRRRRPPGVRTRPCGRLLGPAVFCRRRQAWVAGSHLRRRSWRPAVAPTGGVAIADIIMRERMPVMLDLARCPRPPGEPSWPTSSSGYTTRTASRCTSWSTRRTCSRRNVSSPRGTGCRVCFRDAASGRRPGAAAAVRRRAAAAFRGARVARAGRFEVRGGVGIPSCIG